MKVKEVKNIIGKKVIDPISGKVGVFKGNCGDLIFLGTNNTNHCTVFPFYVPKEEFNEWNLANSNDKVNIHTL